MDLVISEGWTNEGVLWFAVAETTKGRLFLAHMEGHEKPIVRTTLMDVEPYVNAAKTEGVTIEVCPLEDHNTQQKEAA